MDRERQYRRTIQNFPARGSGRELSIPLGICWVAFGWGPGDTTKGLSVTGLNPWSCQISPTSHIPHRCNIKRLEWKLTDHATCHPWEHTRKQPLLGRWEVVAWRKAMPCNNCLTFTLPQPRPSKDPGALNSPSIKQKLTPRKVWEERGGCREVKQLAKITLQVDERVSVMWQRSCLLLKQDRERHSIRQYPPMSSY